MDIPPVVGALLIFLGMIFLLLGGIFLYDEHEKTEESEEGQGEKEGKTKAGGIILIGPIPIVFSNDKRLLEFLIAIVIAIFVIYLILLFL